VRVLVCGGRTFGALDPHAPPEAFRRECARVSRELFHLGQTLDGLHVDRCVTAVIHGGAPGADEMAGLWAESTGIAVQCFPANWKAHGKAAGPIRNKRMLDEGKPDLVVAFPGGRGTANMVAQARAAGVEVIEVTGP
jgi:hypothetical protein